MGRTVALRQQILLRKPGRGVSSCHMVDQGGVQDAVVQTKLGVRVMGVAVEATGLARAGPADAG